ncbi:hypothetical protein [Rhizosaccharibacter radicis]|uniref:Ribbon-helix-helix protein CopG domain-containing protein n=1 Tax=Rhizosaccharibacter radicis TaxID=2782605 RepID=A0ABT1W2R3_9PROT|nr:hypothetical protein [Acetobacteraceae bacterium KSS12]
MADDEPPDPRKERMVSFTIGEEDLARLTDRCRHFGLQRARGIRTLIRFGLDRSAGPDDEPDLRTCEERDKRRAEGGGRRTMRRIDTLNETACSLAIAAGVYPEQRVPMPGNPHRTMPAWCGFREAVRAQASRPSGRKIPVMPTARSPSLARTVRQMRDCMWVGNAAAGVICADGHPGYAQPVGGVIAYENQVSISATRCAASVGRRWTRGCASGAWC